jgi:OOP family OmpA-OmpF porin
VLRLKNYGNKYFFDFNKWSVELSGGLNKPMRPMSAGYRTAVTSVYVADLGVRYMFNNKFGLADFGYNSFKEGENSDLTQNTIDKFSS